MASFRSQNRRADSCRRADFMEINIAAMQNPEDPYLQFLLGVLLQDCQRVKKYLDQGINANIPFMDESTALHIAAENENVELLHLLLTYPETNTNLPDVAGVTPLNIAARNGNKVIAQLLIQYNTDVDKYDKFHYTPLHTAILNNNEDIVTLLLHSHANPNILDSFGRTPLYLAAKEVEDPVMVKRLLDHGADPNLYSQAYTMPLLMECCLTCNTESQLHIIVQLIEGGCKVNEIYPITRRTALHIAAFNGYPDLVKTLLKFGARTDVVDIRRMTPFQIAREQHNRGAARYLKPRLGFRRLTLKGSRLSTPIDKQAS